LPHDANLMTTLGAAPGLAVPLAWRPARLHPAAQAHA